MGQKSRKNKKNKQWVKKFPDEVFRHGPISIERYGNFIKYSNDSTEEEHKDFLQRSEIAHKEIFEDLKNEVSLLQILISKYDPVILMHRIAYVLMPLLMKYRSENEYTSNESYYLPTAEYIQYLIARTNCTINDKELSEEVFNQIWEQGLKVLKLTQSYLFTRPTLGTPPSEIDELRHDIDGRRLLVRVKRYPIFLIDYLRSSLTPYGRWIKEIYGIEVESIIQELGKIFEYQKYGVGERYLSLMTLTKTLYFKLMEQGFSVNPGASPEEEERTRKALVSEEFKNMQEEMQEKGRLALTPAIFEITGLTSLPKSVLSLLSVKPGESILTTLTGPNYEDLSPLSTSALHYKPFLEANGKFYHFFHSGLEDRMAEIIEADLFGKRPGAISDMAKERSNRVELDSKNLLSSIVHPDFAFLNVYYPNPDEGGGLTELDIILGAGDILFLVEVKAGGFSESASRGAPKSIEKELSDLIIEGQRQSERAEKYIKSNNEVPFFNETGKNEILRIRQSDFRKVYRIVVTKEDLGWVGAKIAILSVLDPTLNVSYPWHISIDDLRIVADLFHNDPICFVHYLELRLQASSEKILRQNDEIEHIALYHKLNYYHELPVKDMDLISFDPSHMREIDYYFSNKSKGETPKVPTQMMPEKMKELVIALRDCSLKSRFEAGSIILSIDEAGRDKFEKGLITLEKGRQEKRQLTFRLPFAAHSYGLTVTCANDKYWEEELRRSAVQMAQGNCGRWLVVQLADKSPYEISRIEAIIPGRFSDEELVSERIRHEQKSQSVIVKENPGRNDFCPCGSGKKYKRCHGFNA